MDYGYLRSYRQKKINHHKLHAKILDLFRESGESVDKLRLYDEVLFILDQRTAGGKAPRGICDELFNQTKNSDSKTSINKMAWAYIENLETAKLCLLRDENKIAELKARSSSGSGRGSTFVHLQIVQVSVYSRFTKDATLSYSIYPSSIPPVSLQNAINPILNHEFTFRLEETNEFTIVFMDSGISIGKWSFPDQPGLAEGEYHRLVTSQNVNFQVKIKYLPKDSNPTKTAVASELDRIEKQRQTSKAAFDSLVAFEPFLNKSSKLKVFPEIDEMQEANGVEEYEGCMSFMGSHVRNLFVLLVALILGECLFSYYSAVEFLDIMLAFYLIGILYNKQIDNYQEYQNTFLVIAAAFVVLTLKSFLNMGARPFYDNQGARVFMCVICTIAKILVLATTAIAINNLADTSIQRNKFFYGQQYRPAPTLTPVARTEKGDDIYQDLASQRW